MKTLTSLMLLLAALITSDVLAQEKWQIAKSKDGVVRALLPGTPVSKVEKRRTWAGTIATDVTRFRAKDVAFTVSSTKLSQMIRRFASDQKIFDSSKEGVLNEAFGREVSFEKITVDGIPARILRYEVVDFDDAKHKGYHGVAVFIIHENTTYVANALIRKDAGDADLIKFRDSLKINKKPSKKK